VPHYVYLAHLSVPADIEEEFNRLYDEGYVPALLKVPGVLSCTRYRLEWADTAETPEYLAIYEVADPEIPRSRAWREASVQCGWAATIRPHLRVRRHGLYRGLAGGAFAAPAPGAKDGAQDPTSA
jgi:hypothetical protein